MNTSMNTPHTKKISIVILILLLAAAFLIFGFLQYSDYAKAPKDAGTTTATPSSANVGSTPLPTDSTTIQDTTSTSIPVVPSSTEAISQTNASSVVLPIYPVSESRVTFKDGFYYEPVAGNEALKERIRGLSYNETINTAVPYEVLSYVRVKYMDFQNQTQEGELICHQQIAQDLVEIFYDLYQAQYQIQSIRLIDDFGADDQTSMEANNTSCFNYRYRTGSNSALSNHSYGTAIDINPLYNPYVTGEYKGATVVPASGAAYADRSQDFAHKIDTSDLCYQLFKEHGFTWGGEWNSVKDYQHFEKAHPLG